MAFDTATRNRLNKFVSDARRLLTEEFTNQFQVDYGMDPDTGEVAELDRLSHLDDARRQTAVILRETLAHYYSNLPTKNKKKEADDKQLIERIIREQAFTILNRLCAIRMAEARDLVIESVAAGLQSKGFQLYQPVVGNSLGETGAAYQQYLLCLFDEFAVDLPVLFDRFSPQGRLFPRESVLMELLDLINDAEINQLWAEDETIGWIYQYFNSKEERKAMRDASQAPRNSRELAVRNQFFTPRYVVEFLTDNTLGRIWYEMRKGETGLKETCQYLVRRPNENFLAEGKEAPETEQDDQEKDLTQEELLNQPVNIPHRPLKDPREIRMLDPACGSMHFGLYAFDLYLKIYEEYWDLITADPDTAVLPSALSPLPSAYSDKAEFMKAVPRLIIEHNIHGIDIDPRAVQIAGLSLWLRAQRAWKSQGIAAGDRPQVTRSNVVCAEPMPGDKQQLEAFCKELHPAIAQMVTAIFEEMKLAGEAGSLLKIEQEISSLVAAAKKQFQDNPPDKKIQQQFFGGASVVKEQQMEFDLSGITDELFFEKAEEEIYEALSKYASESSEGGFRRKLFAGDAEKGFAFVDVLTNSFDVVLMNPPFGAGSKQAKPYVDRQYKKWRYDVYPCFVSRGNSLLNSAGRLGAITNRTGFFLSRMENWRKDQLLESFFLTTLADLGHQVLDDALVEVAAYVITPQKSALPIDAFSCLRKTGSEKGVYLLDVLRHTAVGTQTNDAFSIQTKDIIKLPLSAIAYWVPRSLLAAIASNNSLEDFGFEVREGLHTSDNERFLRLWWEVPHVSLAAKHFVPLAKGGDYAPYHSDIHLCLYWKNEGSDILASKHGVVPSKQLYFKKGLTFTRRTASAFSVRPMPEGGIFSESGMMIYHPSEEELYIALAYLMSSPARAILEMFVGSGEASHAGSAARHFLAGTVSKIPYPDFDNDHREEMATIGRKLAGTAAKLATCFSEIHREFGSPKALGTLSLKEMAEEARNYEIDCCRETLRLSEKANGCVIDCFGIDKSAQSMIEQEIFPHPLRYSGEFPQDRLSEIQKINDDSLVYDAYEVQNSRGIMKLAYLGNRRLELICHLTKCSPDSVPSSTIKLDQKGVAETAFSYFFGISMGRWNITTIRQELTIDPFAECKFIPSGLLTEGSQPVQNDAQLPSGYPINVSLEVAPTEVVTDQIHASVAHLWSGCASEFESEMLRVLECSSIAEYLEKPSGFFDHHLAEYSKSRRSAPIYWPISTESGSYTLWFYYHRLTDQTLYKAVLDFVDPKLKQTVRQLGDLRAIKDRSSVQEKELAQLTEMESELEQFKADLLEIAAFWKPNLNDGVQITAAPLHKFFRLKKWRDKLAKTWKELEAGEYDWAHLALSIWPDRVVRKKCTSDRSIAIAHDLEEQLWHEVEVEKKSKSGRVTTKTEWQPRNLTDAQLDAIVDAVKSGKRPPASEPNSSPKKKI